MSVWGMMRDYLDRIRELDRELLETSDTKRRAAILAELEDLHLGIEECRQDERHEVAMGWSDDTDD